MSGTTETKADAVTRGPYLQLGTPTSIVVRWRTDVDTDSRVLYGTELGNLISSSEELALTTDHEVTLAGLLFDTRYYYAIGTTSQVLAGDDADHFFDTNPLPGTPEPARIWVLGDSGTGNSSATAVRDAYFTFTGSQHTHLWLMLGDNAYPAGTDEQYQYNLFDIYPQMLRKSVLWPTLGNHDAASADSPTQSGPYYEIFTLPAAGEAGGVASGTEAYYAFDYGNIHFVVLDSQDTPLTPPSSMLNWLDLDLASTVQDWVIAYWHHPPYSKGSHDSDTELQLVEMRENVLPILENHGADLVLSGHSHSYERSLLIDGHYGSSDTFNADPVATGGHVVDGGDGSIGGDGVYTKPGLGPDPHQGTVYTVAGNAGLISGGPLNHPVMTISLNMLGSVILDVDGSRLDATFLDSAGVVRDGYTLLKGCSVGDGDGDAVCDDVDNCPNDTNPGQEDSDGDGIGDACEIPGDDDADGVLDQDDNCPTVPNSGQANGDNDDLGDACDNCPDKNNQNQNDNDGDGVGNPCDNCGNVYNPDQSDGDGDGIGDACDPGTDTDGDGIEDPDDNCPTIPNPDQTNSDGDTLGDACDNCPNDTNENQNDSDGDGVGNKCDNCNNVYNPGQLDSDGDGIGDACDSITDSDGDGVDDSLDCAPSTVGVASLPGPIGALLRLDKLGGTTLYWSRAVQGHTSNVYRGETTTIQPPLSPICLVAAHPQTDIGDAALPPSGSVFFYLVSARNLCGDGSPGQDSEGVERSGWMPCAPASGDFDADGIPDLSDNCPVAPNASQADADGDFAGDPCDACPTDLSKVEPGVCGCWAPEVDTDADDLLDCLDNCPAVLNPEQTDSDMDGVGDACEDPGDADGDGVPDENDNCPDVSNLSQIDTDGDNIGNACDNCPDTNNHGQADNDDDGVGNQCDNCTNVFNPDQADSDGDGIGDACDT